MAGAAGNPFVPEGRHSFWFQGQIIRGKGTLAKRARQRAPARRDGWAKPIKGHCRTRPHSKRRALVPRPRVRPGAGRSRVALLPPRSSPSQRQPASRVACGGGQGRRRGLRLGGRRRTPSHAAAVDVGCCCGGGARGESVTVTLWRLDRRSVAILRGQAVGEGGGRARMPVESANSAGEEHPGGRGRTVSVDAHSCGWCSPRVAALGLPRQRPGHTGSHLTLPWLA